LGWFQSPKDKPVSQARLMKIFTIIWIQKDPTGQDFMLSNDKISDISYLPLLQNHQPVLFYDLYMNH
jgi:hypothetical protein